MVRSAAFLLGLGLLLLGSGENPHGTTGDDPVLLVANKNGNSLYFVDPGSGRTMDSVSTGEGPHEVAAAPVASRAYVANYAGGTVSVVDVASRSVVEQWPLDSYDRPHSIAVGPDEERVYVTAEDQQAVLEIDATSGAVRRVFETGKDVTHMLALPSDASFLFATSIGSGRVSKIDLEAGRVVTHTGTGDGAEGVAVTPNDEAVWVTNRAEDTVSILDAETAAVIDSLSAPGFPIRVAFSPNGRHGIVSTPQAGEVVLYDAAERRPRTRLRVGKKPIGVLVPTNTQAFVANAGSSTVSVINLATQSVVGTILAGNGPDGMAYLPAE